MRNPVKRLAYWYGFGRDFRKGIRAVFEPIIESWDEDTQREYRRLQREYHRESQRRS